MARERNLPLERSKHERLILRGQKRRKKGDVQKAKWLGVILDENLNFELHWRDRIARARKMLGNLTGCGKGLWGLSPNSWRQTYISMIRTIALWGSELGWSGQRDWEREFNRLQYQALRKATQAIKGSRMTSQHRNGGTTEQANEKDHERPICFRRSESRGGGPLHNADYRGERNTVKGGRSAKLWRTNPKDGNPHIGSHEKDGPRSGGVEQGGGKAIGKVATVWDGEVNGIRTGIEQSDANKKVLILTDSQAAVKAIKKAGRTGKARTRDLQRIFELINERQSIMGPQAVALGWVKAHIGITGNEKADEEAKRASSLMPEMEHITEGGIKQWWRRSRTRERKKEDTVQGRAIKWNRTALRNYTHCRTGKGRLGRWRNILDPWEDQSCRWCNAEDETGNHIAISCPQGEWLGRRWSTWEQMTEAERWKRKEKEGDREITIDLVEDFFARLDL